MIRKLTITIIALATSSIFWLISNPLEPSAHGYVEISVLVALDGLCTALVAGALAVLWKKDGTLRALSILAWLESAIRWQPVTMNGNLILFIIAMAVAAPAMVISIVIAASTPTWMLTFQTLPLWRPGTSFGLLGLALLALMAGYRASGTYYELENEALSGGSKSREPDRCDNCQRTDCPTRPEDRLRYLADGSLVKLPCRFALERETRMEFAS